MVISLIIEHRKIFAITVNDAQHQTKQISTNNCLSMLRKVTKVVFTENSNKNHKHRWTERKKLLKSTTINIVITFTCSLIVQYSCIYVIVCTLKHIIFADIWATWKVLDLAYNQHETQDIGGSIWVCCCLRPWIHGLRPKKLYTSVVVVTPTSVQVPTQLPLTSIDCD